MKIDRIERINNAVNYFQDGGKYHTENARMYYGLQFSELAQKSCRRADDCKRAGKRMKQLLIKELKKTLKELENDQETN